MTYQGDLSGLHSSHGEWAISAVSWHKQWCPSFVGLLYQHARKWPYLIYRPLLSLISIVKCVFKV